MTMNPNDDARPIRLTVQQIGVDRRGRRRFMVFAAGGHIVCASSPNPIPCASAKLLDRGYDPATPIIFVDAMLPGFEERMTLAEAIALDDVVVPMRRREQR